MEDGTQELSESSDTSNPHQGGDNKGRERSETSSGVNLSSPVSNAGLGGETTKSAPSVTTASMESDLLEGGESKGSDSSPTIPWTCAVTHGGPKIITPESKSREKAETGPTRRIQNVKEVFTPAFNNKVGVKEIVKEKKDLTKAQEEMMKQFNLPAKSTSRPVFYPSLRVGGFYNVIIPTLI